MKELKIYVTNEIEIKLVRVYHSHYKVTVKAKGKSEIINRYVEYSEAEFIFNYFVKNFL